MIRINKFFITLIDRKGRIGLKTLRVVENPRRGARLSDIQKSTQCDF